MKELQIKEPIISFSPPIDNFLSVLGNDIDSTLPWILENYIELILRNDSENPNIFEFHDLTKCWWMCPFVHVSRLHRDVISVSDSTFTDFIRSMIDKDFYVFFVGDTYYNKNYPTYMKSHFGHEIFIYGYNNQSYLTIDYFDFQKRSKRLSLFEEVQQSFENLDRTEDSLNGIILFKNNTLNNNFLLSAHEEFSKGIYSIEKHGYKIDLPTLKIKLAYFLYEKYAQLHYPNHFDIKFNYITGFSTINAFCEFIKKGDNNTQYLYFKHFHLLYSHIYLMKVRIAYVNKVYFQSESLCDLENEVGIIMYDALKLRNIALKGAIKNNYNYYMLSSLLQSISDRYFQAIKEFISRI